MQKSVCPGSNVRVTRGGGLSSSSASKGWHVCNALAEHVCEWVCFWPKALDFIALDWLSWKITSPSRFLLTEFGHYANTTRDCMSVTPGESDKWGNKLEFTFWLYCEQVMPMFEKLITALCEDVGCTPLGLGNTDLIHLAFEEICGPLWVCTSFGVLCSRCFIIGRSCHCVTRREWLLLKLICNAEVVFAPLHFKT